jgi:predicted acetyltransferase
MTTAQSAVSAAWRHELNDVLLHHGGHIGYYVRPSARGKRYGTAILDLTLAEGRKRGIERFLLTVDSNNVPSIRVIEGNGGVLEDERLDEETGRMFRRYWIA